MERLFIAININEVPRLSPLLKNTRVLLRKEGMRWIPENNLHITLRFLGSVSSDDIPKINRLVGQVAKEFDDFYFQLSGLGTFGTRVLWAGVEYNPELLELQEKIDEVLLPLFEKEHREYVPHLTLARIKHLDNKNTFFKIVDANREAALDLVRVQEICLMKSELRLAGPVYSVVKKFPLHVHEKANCH